MGYLGKIVHQSIEVKPSAGGGYLSTTNTLTTTPYIYYSGNLYDVKSTIRHEVYHSKESKEKREKYSFIAHGQVYMQKKDIILLWVSRKIA